MSEFREYETVKDKGPLHVLRVAKRAGLDQAARIRMIRELFGLSLVDAKRIVVEEETGRSLEELQEALAEPLARVLADGDRD